jgi:hypothetical protein
MASLRSDPVRSNPNNRAVSTTKTRRISRGREKLHVQSALAARNTLGLLIDVDLPT